MVIHNPVSAKLNSLGLRAALSLVYVRYGSYTYLSVSILYESRLLSIVRFSYQCE
jgi:hypothetical protein